MQIRVKSMRDIADSVAVASAASWGLGGVKRGCGASGDVSEEHAPGLKTLEDALTKADLDYAVEIAEYEGGLFSGIVFRTTPKGAYFYVLPDQLERARQVTRDAGFTPFDSV